MTTSAKALPFHLRPGDHVLRQHDIGVVAGVTKVAAVDRRWSVLFTDDAVLEVDEDHIFERVAVRASTDPATLCETKRVLWEMLTENTGRHMLDSGGAYGRHWERNQSRDFEAQPDATVRFDARYGEIEVQLSVYHWLADRLEYDARVDKLFERFAQRPSQRDVYWLESMRAFPEFLARFGFECSGFYGDGEPRLTNSYNDENALSQDIQFLLFNVESPDGCQESYVLLQIHGGCDARGGYTRPRAFRVVGESDETCMYDYGRVALSCNNKPHADALCPNRGAHLKALIRDCDGAHPGDYHGWLSDNGGATWEDAGDLGVPASLRDFKGLKFAIIGDRDLAADDPANHDGARIVSRWQKGLLCVTEDGRGLCPVCGGELSAGGLLMSGGVGLSPSLEVTCVTCRRRYSSHALSALPYAGRTEDPRSGVKTTYGECYCGERLAVYKTPVPAE